MSVSWVAVSISSVSTLSGLLAEIICLVRIQKARNTLIPPFYVTILGMPFSKAARIVFHSLNSSGDSHLMTSKLSEGKNDRKRDRNITENDAR